jgi:hypothetical protein
MNKEIQQIRACINKFYRLLNQYPDDPKSTFIYTNFLRQFLRLKPKEATLPTIEIISLLKHEKPIVFYLIKQQGKYDDTLELLTNIYIDPEKAKKNLHQIMNE